MSSIAVNDDELKPQTPPKPTIKQLYDRLTTLERDYKTLIQRVQSVEQQLTEQQLRIGDIAVTTDRLMWSNSLITANEISAGQNTMTDNQTETEAGISEDAAKNTRIPRSQRHVAARRKFLWFN